ncbi:hypothetical protein RhiXN_11079 [Rhizoctonia solani]|uniref:Uncharacterized protein n=1 Tax=Rhizoctonia solani TaxID=456999 RepID=A0A8H8P828_9AGAM|nr:uncharacterized protein RhiXN_11079 [Rhizoctonia solani]QRW26002.1 hypothetical protein RhiXN_11079 [Rhizoctonia solani]
MGCIALHKRVIICGQPRGFDGLPETSLNPRLNAYSIHGRVYDVQEKSPINIFLPSLPLEPSLPHKDKTKHPVVPSQTLATTKDQANDSNAEQNHENIATYTQQLKESDSSQRGDAHTTDSLDSVPRAYIEQIDDSSPNAHSNPTSSEYLSSPPSHNSSQRRPSASITLSDQSFRWPSERASERNPAEDYYIPADYIKRAQLAFS